MSHSASCRQLPMATEMKPSVASASPMVAATLAVATISLSAFLLPGAEIQSGPTPLLPALGAGRVSADLPAVALTRSSKPIQNVEFAPALGSTPRERVVQRPEPASKTQPVHPHPRTRVVRRTVSAPAPTAPATSVVRRFVSAPPAARARARGHGQARAVKVPAIAPTAHEHGNRQSRKHRHDPGGRREENVPAASPPAPAAPPQANDGDNGLKRGKK